MDALRTPRPPSPVRPQTITPSAARRPLAALRLLLTALVLLLPGMAAPAAEFEIVEDEPLWLLPAPILSLDVGIDTDRVRRAGSPAARVVPVVESLPDSPLKAPATADVAVAPARIAPVSASTRSDASVILPRRALREPEPPPMLLPAARPRAKPVEIPQPPLDTLVERPVETPLEAPLETAIAAPAATPEVMPIAQAAASPMPAVAREIFPLDPPARAPRSVDSAAAAPPPPELATLDSPRNESLAEADAAMPPPAAPERLLQLGPGDAVLVHVFGRPEMDTTTYVSENGMISVPLAGSIKVLGLTPAQAATQVAKALRDGQYLVNPQVTIQLTSYRSQTVSVLGEVKAPGRFPIESRTTVFDLLAQAGGVLETGSDTVYLLRPDKQGQPQRVPVNLQSLTGASPQAAPRLALRGGDSIFVPRAEQYYVYGEVAHPNRYRLEPGTTVVQAISRSGGLTARGSERRIEIKRRSADGKYETIDARLSDTVRADDVIRVKERIF